jgi:hypothetical protein
MLRGSYSNGHDKPGVRKMSSADSKSASTNAIARSAVVLDFALVEAASGVAGRVAVEHGGDDVVRVDARLGDGVGDDEATLRVAAERDLGIGALGPGLLDELGHDGTALAALVGVAGDGSFVVYTLDRNAVGAEGLLQSGGEGRADGGTEVLEGLSVYSVRRMFLESHTPGSVEPRAKIKVTGAHLPSTMSLRVLPPELPPRLNWRFSTGTAMAIEAA